MLGFFHLDIEACCVFVKTIIFTATTTITMSELPKDVDLLIKVPGSSANIGPGFDAIGELFFFGDPEEKTQPKLILSMWSRSGIIRVLGGLRDLYANRGRSTPLKLFDHV